MAEPGKWELNPHATLGEIARQDDDPGYEKTICGIHRILWTLINVDLNGYIPQEHLDKLNSHMEKAYKMGKRMHFRLKEYYLEAHPEGSDKVTPEMFVEEVQFPDRPAN